MKILKYLFLVSIVLLFNCKKKEEATVEHIRAVKAVLSETAEDQLSKGFLAVSTQTRAADLSFRISSPLVQLTIEEGIEVKKGQLFAEIDPSDYKVALIGAEGRMNQEKAEEQRYNLYKKGSLKKSNLKRIMKHQIKKQG